MFHRRILAIFLLTALGLVATLRPFPAEAAKTRKSKSAMRPTIRLGIVQTLFRDTPEPLMQILMRPFKTLMEEQTGVNSLLVNGGDHYELGQQLADDKLQLGVFH